jgi:hypothetical protein
MGGETREERAARTREPLSKLRALRGQIAAETNGEFDSVRDLAEVRAERLAELDPG